jgi:hypothetical protein
MAAGRVYLLAHSSPVQPTSSSLNIFRFDYLFCGAFASLRTLWLIIHPSNYICIDLIRPRMVLRAEQNGGTTTLLLAVLLEGMHGICLSIISISTTFIFIVVASPTTCSSASRSSTGLLKLIRYS